ncbi:MAG: hypothetical protein U5L96_05475 [Owenweeksia sp.]|nr:hypothetical protein [Owenweeksia sp.]
MTYSIDFGGYYGNSQIAYNTVGATTQHSFANVPQSDTLDLRIIFKGDFDDQFERFSLQIDGTYYYGYIYNNNRNHQLDTIDLQFYGSNVQNWTADNSLSFNINNSSSVDGSTGSFHRVEVKLTSQVNWVSIIGASSGSIAANSIRKRPCSLMRQIWRWGRITLA